MVSIDTTKKITKHVNDSRAGIIRELQELIRTPSINPGFGVGEGEREIASKLREKLKEIGVSRIEILEKVKGRPNLVATLKGSIGKPTLMLNGHMDTVIVDRKHLWTVDPFSGTLKDGDVYGLGSCDMKGAIVSMLAAAAAIVDLDAKLSGNLLLVFSADEEWGSGVGVKWLIEEKGLRADAAIVTEPSSIKKPLDRLHIALRGTVDIIIKVYGDQMHSGLADIEKPVNATEKMAHVILRMKKDLKLRYPSPKYGLRPNANIGVTVKGGQHQWSVPGECAFGVDIRIIPGMKPEQVVEDVQKFLKRLRKQDPKLTVEMEMFPGGAGVVPPAEIPPDEPIVKHMLSAAKKALGYAPRLGCFPGGDDATFMINSAQIPTIASFGPGFLKYAHAPNEKVSIDEVVNAGKVYALTGLSYLAGC